MVPIKITALTKGAQRKVERLQRALDIAQIDAVVDEVSLIVLGWLIEATPKKEGTARRAWKVMTPRAARREIYNTAKVRTVVRGEVPVLELLATGTGIYGPSGTRVVSPNGNAMFVPIGIRGIGGWRPGLRYGIDYVMAKSVKGIRPTRARKPVAAVRPRAEKLLVKRLVAHLKRAIGE